MEQDLVSEHARLLGENERLKAAIRKHRDQRGDDRCWLDDGELYGVLGEGLSNQELPPHDEFISNCERYWKCRQSDGEKYEAASRVRALEAVLSVATRKLEQIGNERNDRIMYLDAAEIRHMAREALSEPTIAAEAERIRVLEEENEKLKAG